MAERAREGRYAIVGPGAVGLGIGTALLAAGSAVHFVGREASVRALRERGCSRVGIFGSARFEAGAFEASSELASLEEREAGAASPLDAILVATKSYSGAALAEALGKSALATKRIPLVLFMNGLGNAERFAEHWDPALLYNARVITGFRRLDPGCVEATVHADAIAIGSLREAAPMAPAEELATRLSAGGLPARATSSIEKDLWSKVLYNAALNPLGAILGVPYGVLGERESTRSVIARIVDEAFEVIRATGARTHWDRADEFLRDFYRHSLPPTRAHESSMLQDLRAGRRTEIDAICGEIVRRGRSAGVAAPTNEALVVLIEALEARGCETSEREQVTRATG